MAELNLIPSSLRNKRNKKSKNQNIIYGAVIIGAILFFGLYFPYMTMQTLKNNEADKKFQVDAQYNVIVERNKMVDNINKINVLVSKVEDLQKNRVLSYKQIVELQKSAPADVVFTSLSYSVDAINIVGISKSYYSPEVLLANLQETEAYKKSQLVSISKETADYSFSINVKLK